MALTQNRLTASMYFAVGYGTEGGKDAFRLSIAGLRNDKDAWDPTNIGKVAGASGYTIGMLQLDFGQLGLAALGTNNKAGPDQTAYVDAFVSNVQAYGDANSNVPQLSGDMSLLRSQILSHGKNISFISDDNRRE